MVYFYPIFYYHINAGNSHQLQIEGFDIKDLKTRYGSWALVAGASEGLGAAYAEALAKHGFNLILIARREHKLLELAGSLGKKYKIEVQSHALDLAKISDIIDILEKDALDIGLLVYNAAYAPIAPFSKVSKEQLDMVTDVNVKGPLLLSKYVSKNMIEQQRGAIILMSSLAGTQGSPKLVAYSASKAFNAILAEGLWGELRSQGIDVLASVAGAIRTPGYAAAQKKSAPGTLDADTVVTKTLNALGKRPLVVPGLTNKIARFLMGRLLPRTWAISMMKKNTESLE